ncbi:MAG: phosphopantetheine-binding protein, partial [Anaerolineales bacterium]
DSFPESQPAAPTPEPTPEPVPMQVEPTAVTVETRTLPAEEEIVEFLLNLVSEKTGYPPEILEMDLDLEADLGIDTVKQAELFAAVREHFGIPRREDLMLVDYNTLQKVVGFVQESFPESQPAAPTPEPAPEPVSVQVETVQDKQPSTDSKPFENISEPEDEGEIIVRRIPTPILRPKLDLCLPTGVTLEEGDRVLIVEGTHDAGEALSNLLLTRKVSVLRVKLEAGQSLESQIQTWADQGHIDGIYFLASLSPETPLKDMTHKEWEMILKTRVYALYQIMKVLPSDSFLICATNTGGLHGYNQESMNSTGGGVSGFCKALAQERADILIKIIDFETSEEADRIAVQLVSETLKDPAVRRYGRNHSSCRPTSLLKHKREILPAGSLSAPNHRRSGF